VNESDVTIDKHTIAQNLFDYKQQNSTHPHTLTSTHTNCEAHHHCNITFAKTKLKSRKEAEEKARVEAEEAARKLADEQAAYDSDKDLIPPKEDPGISWEPVEEEESAIPAVLQELYAEREATETEDESEIEMSERDRDLEWQRQRQMMRPPLVISHLKSRAVPTDSTAKLTCNVSGPSISVRWLKNGNPIEINPNKYKFFNSEGLLSLEIYKIDKHDAAEYICFAKNKNGETSTVANLTVYDNLDIDRPTPPTFITIKGKLLMQRKA